MNRGLVYFHFDPHHQVRDYVVTALSSLRPHADHILLVSNSPIRDADRSRLETCCDQVLQRPNEGLDAGAYRAGLEHLGWDRLADFDELILTNHTCYAPLRPWEEVLTRAEGWRDISFWGMTEHAAMRPHPFLARRELPRHIQSHWIAVRRRLLTAPAFREYWERMPPVSSYRDSIQWHESRFTDHFAELGHTWEVAFPVDRYRSDNPAIEEAPALLADGCPLLKRRALFHDPLHQDRQAVVGGELLEDAARAGYSEDLILSDVVHNAPARDLIVNAGLTEVVVEAAPAPDEPDPEAGSTAPTPSGCVVVHVPAGKEAVERAEAEDLAIVLGSRFLDGKTDVGWLKRLVLRTVAVVSSRTSGMHLTDAHNGLRLLRRDAAERLNLRQNRMAHASEIIRQLGATGLPWREFPVHIAYTEYSRAKGQSLLNSVNILVDLIFS